MVQDCKFRSVLVFYPSLILPCITTNASWIKITKFWETIKNNYREWNAFLTIFCEKAFFSMKSTLVLSASEQAASVSIVNIRVAGRTLYRQQLKFNYSKQLCCRRELHSRQLYWESVAQVIHPHFGRYEHVSLWVYVNLIPRVFSYRGCSKTQH